MCVCARVCARAHASTLSPHTYAHIFSYKIHHATSHIYIYIPVARTHARTRTHTHAHACTRTQRHWFCTCNAGRAAKGGVGGQVVAHGAAAHAAACRAPPLWSRYASKASKACVKQAFSGGLPRARICIFTAKRDTSRVQSAKEGAVQCALDRGPRSSPPAPRPPPPKQQVTNSPNKQGNNQTTSCKIYSMQNL